MKKLVFLTNIPSPPQVKWINALSSKYDISCIFTTSIDSAAIPRPSYWRIELPCNFYFSGGKFSVGELNFFPKVLKQLNALNPDILLIGTPWFSFDGLLSYFWAVRKNRVTIMGPIEFSKHSFGILKIIRNKFVYRHLYSRINLFMANGYIHFDYLTLALGIKNTRLFVNFDDYKVFLQHPTRESGQEIVFMYGGRSDLSFRIEEVIDVFARLRKNYHYIRLNISSWGDNIDIYKKKVSESNDLQRSVTFFENRHWDDVADVFLKSDVLINYAEYSPGGGVILCAVASGMGIVTTQGVHAQRLFTIDNYNSLIVSNTTELYEAMEKYITTDKLTNHSKRNKEIALQSLTMERHLEEFTTHLSEVT